MPWPLSLGSPFTLLKIIGWLSMAACASSAVSCVLLIIRKSNPFDIVEVGLWSFACAAYAVGTFRKKRWTWLLGVGLIAVSLVSFWIDVTPDMLKGPESQRPFQLAFVWLGGAGVAGYWAWFLLRNRRYFSEP